MTDKEVGELWSQVIGLQDLNNDQGTPTERTILKHYMISLIRKLVEERAAPARCEHEKAENIAKARAQFGIDPKTWPKE